MRHHLLHSLINPSKGNIRRKNSSGFTHLTYFPYDSELHGFSMLEGKKATLLYIPFSDSFP